MAYEFFFSYTRGNYNSYLQKFFDDLSQELRERRGYNRDKVVGFFDQKEIELGEQWDDEIIHALQEAKVMICIYTPGYFNSIYCGKEWQVFQNRRNEYTRLQKPTENQKPVLPPVIIPILWLAPLPDNLHNEVREIQYMAGDPAEEYNKSGLKYILQKINDYNSFYVNYVKELALKIINASDDYILPKLNPVPALNEVSPIFPVSQKKIPGVPPVPKLAGQEAKHVRFVFVAGDPNEFGDLRSKDLYLDAGGSDWRPFSGMRSIGPYLQNLVSNEDIGFESDKLELTDNLKVEIENAYNQRKIIIFLIDRWTINWNSKYKEILQKFDGEAMPYLINWSVLVPCNEVDDDYNKQRELIDKTLQETFYHRANILKNPTFYRDSIKNVEELGNAVREILVNIKAELHKKAEVGKVISNHVSKPVISN